MAHSRDSAAQAVPITNYRPRVLRAGDLDTAEPPVKAARPRNSARNFFKDAFPVEGLHEVITAHKAKIGVVFTKAAPERPSSVG
jgi:hypothetical protein